MSDGPDSTGNGVRAAVDMLLQLENVSLLSVLPPVDVCIKRRDFFPAITQTHREQIEEWERLLKGSDDAYN